MAYVRVSNTYVLDTTVTVQHYDNLEHLRTQGHVALRHGGWGEDDTKLSRDQVQPLNQ